MFHLVSYKSCRLNQCIPEYVVFNKEVGIYLEGRIYLQEITSY